MMHKKGQVMNQVQGLVLGLVVIGFVLCMGLILVGKLQTIATNMGDTKAANITGEVKNEIAGVSDYIGIIVAAVIMIALLGLIFWIARNRTQ